MASLKKLQTEFALLSQKQEECSNNYQKCFDLIDKFNQLLQQNQSGQQDALDQLGIALKMTASTSQTLMENNEKRDEKMEFLENEVLSLKEFQSTKEIANIKSQINDLKQAVDSFKQQTTVSVASSNIFASKTQEANQTTLWPSVNQHIGLICNELAQRQEKQRNLIIFGLNETTSDYNEVETLIQDVGVSASVSSVFRVGNTTTNKPRPLVVRFLSESDKDSVKNNLRKLKGKSRWDRVSIVQDLTKIQCAEEKIEYQKLLEEQKQKNEENSENGVWKIVGSRGKKLLIFKYDNP